MKIFTSRYPYRLSAILLGSIAAITLSGCGSSADSGAAGSQAVTAAETEASASGTASSTGAGAGQGTDASADTAAAEQSAESGSNADTIASETSEAADSEASSESTSAETSETSDMTSSGSGSEGSAASGSNAAKNAAASGNSSSGSVLPGTGIDSVNEDETYLYATAGEMEDAIESNPLRANRRYKDQNIAVSGEVSEIDAGGTYLRLISENNAGDSVITCRLGTDELVDAAADLAIGQTITVCGRVTDVKDSSGYTIDSTRFDDLSISFTTSDYEDYETIQIVLENGDLSLDIPSAWHGDTASMLLAETENGTTADAGDMNKIIRFQQTDSDGNVNALADLTIMDQQDPVGDITSRETEFEENLGYDAAVSSITYDTANDMARAAVDTEFGSGTTQESALSSAERIGTGTIQTIFFTDSDGSSNYLYRLTMEDLSGDADSMGDNTAYFQNAAESVRRIGTKYWSSRDYTGWHRVSLGEYSFLVKDTWNAFTRDDFAKVTDETLDEKIQYVVLLNEGGTLNNTARLFVLDNGSAANQLSMETLAETNRDALISQISSSISSDNIEVDGVSFDHVNGAFRIKCSIGGDSQLKREDLVVSDNTLYDFGYFTSAKDYSKSIGQFTKCVRSFNIRDAAIMRETEAAEEAAAADSEDASSSETASTASSDETTVE